MNKIELLAPAGSLDKAKIALSYGADAVYVGGRKFSLRARASNFELDDLKELCIYAHSLNKKVYVTMNIIPHDSDFDGLIEYLEYLNDIKVDAIITSSITIIKNAIKYAKDVEVHVSTQMSCYNSKAINFWKNIGAKRIVLARECTMDEISSITCNSPIETEVFIHGGMCASFSGRCVLSNHYTNRDANRGGCAHSCRWNYDLYLNNTKINKDNKFYNMGSKDLMAIEYIPNLIRCGVSSLKIEGRMKSSYYLACVVSGYRHAIDEYYKTNSLNIDQIKEFDQEIRRGENRITSIGFFKGLPSVNEQLYDTFCEMPTQEYVAQVISYNIEKSLCLVEQRNYFSIGDIVEVITPFYTTLPFEITYMIKEDDGELITDANHPLEHIIINMPYEVKTSYMIRKVKNN